MDDIEEHNSVEEPEPQEQPAQKASVRSMGTSRLPDPGDFDFGTIETPTELAPHAAPVTSPVPKTPVLEASTLPPPIDRVRAERDRLVPRWIWGVAGGVIGAIVLIVAAVFFVTSASRVVVPNVTGMSYGEAQTALAGAGFEARVAERRFSSETADVVLTQSPAGGARVAPGSKVSVVVSAGIEEFSMPDVVGDGLQLAKGVLEERGLAVRIENVTSDEASNTVLSSIPAAGATVRSGDVVRLQVAAPQGTDTTLKRYDLSGVSVIIDPGNPATGKDDVTLDIARRVRSLIEASGGTVQMLRSDDGAAVSESLRAEQARESSAAAGVGLSLRVGGDAGRVVSGSGKASKVTSDFPGVALGQLQIAVPPVSTSNDTGDDVFGSVAYPWTRIVIGSWAAPDDDAAFSDPRWADSVARAVYTALGKSFGTRINQ